MLSKWVEIRGGDGVGDAGEVREVKDAEIFQRLVECGAAKEVSRGAAAEVKGKDKGK